MTLAHRVGQIFAPDGWLANALPGFQPRQAQTDMALAVAAVIEDGGALVVEAGTGIGKTYAYLVPALLSGERVVLSTATKNLQDQLFGRDVPRLVQALGLPVRMAQLKGRASYLCLHRLGMARQVGAGVAHALAPPDLQTLANIEVWAGSTQTGDLAELPQWDERSPVLALVTSTRENCLGSACPQWQACHVNQARREALAADLVVVNHHLFFADLAVRESGMAELLPSVRLVVFDEAHRLNETGIQFLGQGISSTQIVDLARDVLAAGLSLARGLADWSALAGQLERAASDWRLCLSTQSAGARLQWLGGAPDGVDPLAWGAGMQAAVLACRSAMQTLQTVTEVAPDFVRLSQRAASLCEQLAAFDLPCPEQAVRWAQGGGGAALQLVQSPLDIAQTVRTRLLGEVSEGELPTSPDGPPGQGVMPNGPSQALRPRAWVFTSATLGDDEKLTWFTEPCGLSHARILKLGSPFDYPRQASLYVPEHVVRPSDPAHSQQVAQLVAHAACILSGRTLVLATSLRALREIGALLLAHFADRPAMEVLIQGQMSKRSLIARFARPQGVGEPGRILVASASFREGVDLPGNSLQLVVIDKLPFPSPADPLVQARGRQLELAGRSPFRAHALPEAAVALKQSAGRLIRSEADQGVLVVCDARLVSMGYGRRLRAALPPMGRLQSEAEFHSALVALAALTKVSTTGL